MNPKKVKNLYKQTSEELDLPEELVKDVLSYMWSQLRKKMSNLEHSAIHVPYVGTFRLSLRKLDDEILKYERFIKAIEIPKNISQYAMLKESEKRLQRLREVREEIFVERQAEIEFRKNMKTGNIIKIWKNKGKILEGIKNRVFKKEHVEVIANERMEICKTCPNIDLSGGSCTVPGTQPCCSVCGCSLSLKTRSLSSSCDNNFWMAVLSDEEADALDKQLEDGDKV